MTIHTIWGDFESEKELIKTGARMMGISYKKAKAIREKALKENEEKRKRIERAIQERKDLEKSIEDKIKARFPDLHFKKCPWCGEEPTIQVNVCRDYWLNKKDIPQSYCVEMRTCEHLHCTRHTLNWYGINEIPDQPTHKNPMYRWDDWNKDGWERAVEEYRKYLSDDWEYKCAGCGKKWRSPPYVAEVNNKKYCDECLEKLFCNENGGIRDDIYHDATNMSTFSDYPEFYTSLREMLECKKIQPSEIYTVRLDVENDKRGSSRMTGFIKGDRWEIWLKKDYKRRSSFNWVGYVWQPKDVEELMKYQLIKKDVQWMN